MITSTEHISRTRDGVQQLRRRWSPIGEPRAAMLIVHGIGEHSGRYEHVGSGFAAAGIDVVAHDQRGFGRSGGDRGHVDSFDDLVDDVDALIVERRELGHPTVLMGHSMGGLVVAAHLTGERPQPDLAVLSAPALAARIPAWQRALAPTLGTLLPRLSVPADFDGALLSRDPRVQTAYEADPLRVPSSSARLGREILRTMGSVAGSLDRIDVPTYVLHGSDDALVPPEASGALGELDVVTRRVWDGLRHECLNEPERDDVIAEIVDWLELHLGTATRGR
ncbi:lysophospholipase [Ilumatobacter sp.]|uniref:alpha/beta hydrolase n=1 Tax=Ilumatobacter sp. TaxID=1967498 RepID=UPI003B51E412